MKGRHLHKLAKELLQRFPQKFAGNFGENKSALKQMKLLDYSKEELNKLAGELSILARRLGPQGAAAGAAVA